MKKIQQEREAKPAHDLKVFVGSNFQCISAACSRIRSKFDQRN